MKYKISVLVISLLVICIAGFVWFKSSAEDNNTVINFEQIKKDQELEDLKKRIAYLETTKNQTPKTVVIDKEEECKRSADNYFTLFEEVNKSDRSTYTSHWNLGIKACLIEIVVRKTSVNGTVSTTGIYNFDITNEEMRNMCSNEVKSGDINSCDDSIFIFMRENLMSK